MKSVITQPLLYDNTCKFPKCNRSATIKNIQQLCSAHYAFCTLNRLNNDLKKIFNSSESFIKKLEWFSGLSISQSQLYTFLNYSRVPFDKQNLKHLISIIGNKRKTRGQFTMSMQELKKALSVPQSHWNQQEAQQASFLLKRSYIDSSLSIPDFSKTLFKDLQEISSIQVSDYLQIDQQALQTLFLNKFNRDSVARQEFQSLVSTQKPQNFSDKFKTKFRHRLKKVYKDVKVAYEALCSYGKSTLNYFRIQRTLKLLKLDSGSQSIKFVMASLGNGHVCQFASFKQFWLGKKKVCEYFDCFMKPLKDGLCDLHSTMKFKEKLTRKKQVQSKASCHNVSVQSRQRLRSARTRSISSTSKHSLKNIRLQESSANLSSTQRIHSPKTGKNTVRVLKSKVLTIPKFIK